MSRYLIVGGKDPAPATTFYNTAYVVAPGGDIVFRQVKAVPIQFFKDGLPAPEQKLWNSPWGKIGICVCYDLSYTRVTDRLVQLGAEALIVPTMDVADWGPAQHELHARIAPVRAAEYGLPIFRLASSGISQLVVQSGRVTATAPCHGDGAMLAGTLEMRGGGRRPLDRWLAPFATAVTALTIIWFLTQRVLGNRQGAGVRTPGSLEALCALRSSQRWLLPLLRWRRGQGRGGRLLQAVSRSLACLHGSDLGIRAMNGISLRLGQASRLPSRFGRDRRDACPTLGFMERLQDTYAKSGSRQF